MRLLERTVSFPAGGVYPTTVEIRFRAWLHWLPGDSVARERAGFALNGESQVIPHRRVSETANSNPGESHEKALRGRALDGAERAIRLPGALSPIELLDFDSGTVSTSRQSENGEYARRRDDGTN